MKKIALTIAIVLGITFGASAQDRGLFNRGTESGYSSDANNRNTNEGLLLPSSHGSGQDQGGTPLDGGALLLIGFGAAYAMKKRSEKK